MRIVTWNVNSIRARLPRVLPWLEQHKPHLVWEEPRGVYRIANTDTSPGNQP